MKARFWTIGLLVALAMAFGALHVFAQDDSTSKIEFTGEITAIQDDGDTLLLTINELTVDATDAETDLVTFEVGLLVKVEGTLDADGTVLASEIYAPATDDSADDSSGDVSDDDMAGDDSGDDSSGDDADGEDMDDPDDLELVGTLDSLDGDTAVVSGLSFDVSQAEVDAVLVVGDMVKVEADYDAETGVWVASELKLYTDDMAEDDASNDGMSDDNSGDDMSDDDMAGDDSGGDPSACVFEVDESSASLRSGPGTGYDVVGYAYDDDKLPVVGIDETGSWVNVSSEAGDAWIAISTGELDDCSGLPVSNMPYQDDSMSGDDDSHNGDDDMVDDDSSHDGEDDDMHDDDSSDDSDDSSDDHSDDHEDDSHEDDSYEEQHD